MQNAIKLEVDKTNVQIKFIFINVQMHRFGPNQNYIQKKTKQNQEFTRLRKKFMNEETVIIYNYVTLEP